LSVPSPALAEVARKHGRVLVHFPQESDAPGSMSYYRDLVAQGLSDLGYDVSVISKRRLVDSARSSLWRTLLRRAPAILSTWPELWHRRLWDPDAWVINISQEYVVPFGTPRSINIIHDLIQVDFPRSKAVRWFYRRVLPICARKSALNISVSRTTAADLAALRIPSKVVYNEFEPSNDRASELPDPRRRPLTACWVGTTARHKNLADYLAAAAAMPDHSFAAVMPERDARRAHLEFDVPSNVALAHSLPTDQYSQLLESSRYLVSTSLAEGFGRPPADGLLAGCDIALSDIPIYRELYEGLAHFYTPGNVRSLITVLSREPTEIYAQGRERIRSWTAQSQLVDVIDQAISAAN
jgi:hypothetical protein